jgi:hypothetical protein
VVMAIQNTKGRLTRCQFRDAFALHFSLLYLSANGLVSVEEPPSATQVTQLHLQSAVGQSALTRSRKL